MKIKGQYDEYNVFATQSGWSYCTVSIYKEFKFLCFKFKRKLYETDTGLKGGSVMRIWQVKKLHKDQLEAWFKLVVKEYEGVIKSYKQEC